MKLKGEEETVIMNEELTRIIEEVAESNYQEYWNLGHAIQGKNGPYNNDDTPVRNTCHWINIYYYLWKKTGKDIYYNIIDKMSYYLLTEARYGINGAVECMTDGQMDHLNGLIGQAWAIEGFISAYKVLGNAELLEKAKSIFFSQRFDEKEKMWVRVELDGTEIGADKVFNHQLWYAAAGAQILEVSPDEKEIRIQVKEFIQGIDTNLLVHTNGLICHYCMHGIGLIQRIKAILRRNLCELTQKGVPGSKFNQTEYEIAYHLFNMYGFAILLKEFRNEDFFTSKKFKKSLVYAMKSEDFRRLENGCKYGYAYNSPAFEFPYVSLIFCDKIEEDKFMNMWEFQMRNTYSQEKKLFCNNVNDGNTLTARLYEITRYLLVAEGYE